MGAFTFSLADAESKGTRVENSLGCTNDDPDKALACMRSKSAHDVTVSISNDLTMGGTGVIFGPNVDGSVLPDSIMESGPVREAESSTGHGRLHRGRIHNDGSFDAAAGSHD